MTRKSYESNGPARPAPVPSDAMAAIVYRIPARLPEIGRRMVERYRHEIADYAALDETILYDDVAGVSVGMFEALLEELRSGHPTDASVLDVFRRGAARRVHQNVPLESLLHAYRLWSEFVWEAIMDAVRPDRPEELRTALDIAGKVIGYTNAISRIVAQAYLDEAQGVWSDREVVRRDVLEALIAGRGDSDEVRRHAASMDLDLQDSYVVVLARRIAPAESADQVASVPDPAGLRVAVTRARRRLRPAAGALAVGLRNDEMVMLYPSQGANALPRICEQSERLAADLGRSGFAVAVGGWHAGLPGIGSSFEEAREALEIAAERGRPGVVVAFGDVIVEHILRASPSSERLVADTLEPLRAYDTRHGTDLVETLRAYMETSFNLTRSASVLSVNPNTVVYRLKRIGELTGRDPRKAGDLLLLCLCLKGLPGMRPIVG